MSLAVLSRSMSRRICGPGEAAAWSSAGAARALWKEGVVRRFFSRQIWSRSTAARSPDSLAGSPRVYGALGAVGDLFPRGILAKSSAPVSMWSSSQPLHSARSPVDGDARHGFSFIRQHKHILVVFGGIVSAIGGTMSLNAFNEVGITAQQTTAKEAKNVSATNIYLDEARKEAISNDMEKAMREEAMNNDVEKARKDAAMKARFEAWMKEHNRRYSTGKEKARRYELFKATAEAIDSWNEKLIKQGKAPSHGTDCFSDYSNDEWANTGSSRQDFVEYDKLFGSKSFVSPEDIRQLKARMERKNEQKLRSLAK